MVAASSSKAIIRIIKEDGWIGSCRFTSSLVDIAIELFGTATTDDSSDKCNTDDKCNEANDAKNTRYSSFILKETIGVISVKTHDQKMVK